MTVMRNAVFRTKGGSDIFRTRTTIADREMILGPQEEKGGLQLTKVSRTKNEIYETYAQPLPLVTTPTYSNLVANGCLRVSKLR